MNTEVELFQGFFTSIWLVFILIVLDWILLWSFYYQVSKVKIKKRYILYTIAWHAVVIAVQYLAGLFIDQTDLVMSLWIPFFYWIGRKHEFSKRLSLFYGLFPLLVILIFSMLYGFAGAYFFPSLDKHLPAASLVLAVIFVLLTNFVIFRIFKVDVMTLQGSDPKINKILVNPLLGVTGSLLLAYIVVIQLVYNVDEWVNNSLAQYVFYLIFAGPIIYFILLMYWNTQSKKYLAHLLEVEKERHYEDLSRYTREIESLYQDIRGFRHDFGNMLISLKESIESEDIEDIRSVYTDVLEKAEVKMNQRAMELVELANVKVDAVKSILSSKILFAKEHQVSMTVEINQEMTEVPIELIDFIRMLSILLDNAIEAAMKSEEKQVMVAFIIEREQLTLVVRNNREETPLSVTKIFEQGYSTKGEGRGTGLATVQELVDTYRDLHLETTLTDDTFTQTLHMGGEIR